MPKFFTQYERPEKVFEIEDDTLIVERAGYVPAKQQIESMMYAGLRLRDFRKDEFDGETDDEALENYDPTRDGDFDLADGSVLLQNIEAKGRVTESGIGDKTGSSVESVPVENKTGEEV